MSKLKLHLLPILLLSIFFLGTPTFAQESEEKILEFKSEIVVGKDASIDVKEYIVFQPSTTTPRHGLEWQIPYVYSVKAFRRATEIDINNVTYYPLFKPEESISNMYSELRENGWLILRIGDSDKYITGAHVYIVEYTLKYSGISYFDQNDEVYLNIIGPGWKIPIEGASATVKLPGEILEKVCYTGPDGSEAQDCTMFDDGDGTLTVQPNSTLAPYEGYTFAVKLPKGVLEDTTKEQVWLAIVSNIGILLPLPLGIYLFGFLRKRYRNEKLTVIPYYEPEKDMDSLLSGTLIGGKFNGKYITAVLIELATMGYLKIREYEKKKYEFVKREKDGNDLPKHLKALFDAIFAHGDVVPLKKLTNFYTTANKVYLEGYQYLKDEDILSNENIKMKSIFSAIGVITLFAGFAAAGFFISNSAIGWMIGILLSAIVLLIFASTIDIRSKKGNEKYYYLLGLKMYINTAEKKRIEFHNDPEKYKEIFEKLLPYAMIFNLEKKWAKQFEDIYTQNPDWYEGNFTTFNAYYLANSLSTLNSSVVKTSSPPSYSSSGGYRSGGWSSGGSGFGGGSSGGGGGGSGGGGW